MDIAASDDASSRWAAYYTAQSGREPRPLLLEALARFEDRSGPASEPLAVDLGCGGGTETIALLRSGWRVLAVDQEPIAIQLVRHRASAIDKDRLQTVVAPYASVSLPTADLVYAGLSLPFCPPEAFPAFWRDILRAIRPGGRLALHLFGKRDGWASVPEMTFHTAEDVRGLLTTLEVEKLDEREYEGASFSGRKHWHVFEVIARKPD